jgi:tol-pal system protein YbgF
MNPTLRKHTFTVFLVVLFCVSGARSALGVSKETIRMMEQLDNLQQAVQSIQKTVDSQTAVLRTLIEQTNESVTSMKATVAEMQKTNQQNLAQTSSRFDSMASQIQALGESLEEAKSRLSKLSDQAAQTQNIITTLNAAAAANSGQQPGPAGPGQPGPGQTGPGPAGSSPNGARDSRPSVPDAQTLYNSGVTYYNGGNYDLALQAFQQYLQYYSETDRASNAQFYVGECYYSQGDYNKAVQAYDRCVEKYPDGSKVATAQLKKGYALLELGQNQAGARELRSLIQRFPNSNEAELARQRLKRLTASAPARTRKR